MAKSKEVHTVPTDVGWANKAGNRTLSNHRKKETAKAAGRKQARQATPPGVAERSGRARSGV